jgi:hypothetical protein
MNNKRLHSLQKYPENVDESHLSSQIDPISKPNMDATKLWHANHPYQEVSG